MQRRGFTVSCIHVADRDRRNAARRQHFAVFLLTLLFARNAPSSLAARLGVGLTFGGACYVALLALDSEFGFDNPWRLPFHIMSLATSALFWPFAAAWFDDDFEWR